MAVCVTGAGGFIGSWLVAVLLEKGYLVHGTVRNKKKAGHLLELPHAGERLRLFEADLLVEGSFDVAFQDCVGVFHTASPFFFNGVSDPESQMLKPAVEGTLSVLRSVCRTPSVKRVIVTSSLAAIIVGNYNLDHVFTEKDWSNEELQRSAQMWYLLSKNLAERALWDFYDGLQESEKTFTVAAINPGMVIGPLLQPSLNTSSELVLKLVDGSKSSYPHAFMMFVDVRDVAESHIAVYENKEAKGRFLCVSCAVTYKELCQSLEKATRGLPGIQIPTHVKGYQPSESPSAPPTGFSKFSNQKLKSLGISFRGMDEMTRDTVKSLQEKQFLPGSPSASL